MVKSPEYMRKYRRKLKSTQDRPRLILKAERMAPNKEATIADVEKRMSELEDVMDKYSIDAVGWPNGVPGTTKEGYDKYREAQEEYAELLNLRSDLIQQELANAPKPVVEQSAKPYVNGFGEATTREITSPIWERDQRRRAKEVEGWLTGDRRRR